MEKDSDLISVNELKERIREPGCRVVDCRFDLFDADKGRNDYLAGHIPGALYANMDTDLAGEITPGSGRHPLPPSATFQRTLTQWGIGNDTLVVAYDGGNGALAARLWWMLKVWLGHRHARVLDGGFAAWRGAGEALETGEPRYTPADFSAISDEAQVATTEEIAAAVAKGLPLHLLDARDAARYKGENEPIDAVAGHVPGARNLPLGGNLTAEGRWRQPAELAAIWRQARQDQANAMPIVMCGSGVTACHLILAASIAGEPLPRLYVGSWSEWIRDPDRPIATGEVP